MGSSISRQAYEKPASTVHQVTLDKANSVADVYKQGEQVVHRSNKDEIYMLRHMFCKLDPAVIKNSVDKIYGQLKLAVKYVSVQELLLIKVFEARHLTATSVRGHSFNPYVKVELVQAQSGVTDEDVTLMLPENGPKYTSAAVPGKFAFNEIFTFKLHQENFANLKLRCSVWSSDGLETDDFFGEIYLDIAELDCVDAVQTTWHDLQPQTDITIGGDMFLNLSYKLPQTFMVTVNKARGIKRTSPDNNPGLSVRVFIPGVPHVHRTSPVRGDEFHVWEETFSFPVPKEELFSRYLVLVVTDANEDDSYFGECHIDLENLDIARGFEGTFRLADMRGSSVVRSRWNRNAVTQELQEALHAHAVYMRPQFLFDRNSPKTKALSVSVPKAFVHSQMRVANGVVVQ